MPRKTIPSVVGSVIAEAADRRIDILTMSDSNNAFGGFGHDHGFQFALSNKFGMYATGIITSKEIGLGGGIGYGYNFADGTDIAVVQNGAPADSVAASYMDGSLTPQAHGYIASGSVTQELGIFTSHPNQFPADPLDIVNSVIKCHLCYGTFDTGAGEFNPGVRLESVPYTNYVTSAAVPTNTGVEGIAFKEMDVTSVPRVATTPGEERITSRFAHVGGTLTGPFVGYYQRMEIPARTTGFSQTTMYGLGGASLYDLATSVLAAHVNTIWLQLYEARRLQESNGDVPKVVIIVNFGANDTVETATPSLGPNPSASPTSPEAYIDNLTAVINKVESVWYANFTDGNLYWLILPTHPLDDDPTKEAQLVTYVTASKAFADTKGNVDCIDYRDSATGAEFAANGWHDSGGDAHLSQLGYESADTLIRRDKFIKRKLV